MTLTQALCLAFAGTITALTLLIVMRELGRRLSRYAARKIEQMTADAIARPLYPTLDAEYRRLVAEEQKP